MTEYQVVYHDHKPRFEEMVKKDLAEGWSLVGGVCVVSFKSSSGVDVPSFYQAMQR